MSLSTWVSNLWPTESLDPTYKAVALAPFDDERLCPSYATAGCQGLWQRVSSAHAMPHPGAVDFATGGTLPVLYHRWVAGRGTGSSWALVLAHFRPKLGHFNQLPEMLPTPALEDSSLVANMINKKVGLAGLLK